MATQLTSPSATEFTRQFKAEIQAHPKLRVNHPFVRAVNAGRLTLDDIRAWACQEWKFKEVVPRVVMLRFLACSDPEFQPKLYEVVEEETAGVSTGTAGHNQMFLEFAEALGLSLADLQNAPTLPATAAHLYFCELVCYTLPWFVVMAAQMGAEGTSPPAMAALAKGFTTNYGLSPEAVRFFTVHVEADSDHGSAAEDVARRYLTSVPVQQLAREATFRRMELTYDVWSLDGRFN
ncbi:MAG TPA: iron-containing redox enzyme family protein [Chloroflexota bacterium]|jgi:pyrroloquinoline-quinone synthase